jgi:hypothetical protein
MLSDMARGCESFGPEEGAARAGRGFCPCIIISCDRQSADVPLLQSDPEFADAQGEFE